MKKEVSSEDSDGSADGDDACSISSSEEEVPVKLRSRKTKARPDTRSATNRLCKNCGSEFKIQQTMFVDSKDVLCRVCKKSKKSSKSSPQYECEVSFLNCKCLGDQNLMAPLHRYAQMYVSSMNQRFESTKRLCIRTSPSKPCYAVSATSPQDTKSVCRSTLRECTRVATKTTARSTTKKLHLEHSMK